MIKKLLVLLCLLLTACQFDTSVLATVEPTPEAITPQTIIDGWIAKGLNVENVKPLIVGVNLPLGTIGGLQFDIPECGDNCGGQVLQFADFDRMFLLRDDWSSQGHHIFIADDIFIQLNAKFDDDFAAQFSIIE